MSETVRQRTLTVAIAAFGAGLFYLINFPLPMLFGPMAGCLVAALFGLKLKGLGQVSVSARAILGVAIGASVTPMVLERLPQMAGTVALVPVYVAVIAAIGVPYFRYFCKYDRTTAYYAAMPGGLSDMLIFGEAAGANVRTLSLIHATRVLIFITLAPFVLTGWYGVELTNAIGQPASEIPVHELAIMVVAGLVGWKGGEKIGLFGAAIIGPLILTAALSLGDIIHMRPPAEALYVAQFLIGMSVGVKYVGVTTQELRHDVLSGTLFVAVLAALAAAITESVTRLGLADPVESFLAFAPAGQAEMTVLAIVAGADLGFVITHHLTRILLVILGAPIVARFLLRPD